MAQLTPEQLAAMSKTLSGIVDQFKNLQQRIATEGITGAGGQMLLAPTQTSGGTTIPNVNSDWRQLYMEALNKYNESISNQKPLTDIYSQYKESLGIPGMETTQTGLTKQITDVEGLLDKLETDINSRASSVGGVMTQAQLNRRQAAEGKPLREQLADLYKAQTTGQTGLTSARSELAAMMQLEEAQRSSQQQNALGLLPYYKEALSTKETEAPTMKEWGGKMYQWDGTKWVDVGVADVVKPIEGKGDLGTSDTEIKNWILEKKRANPDIPYYELWGQLADEIKNQGLNPSNYDKIFWEILHPEGKAGYEKYKKQTEGKTTNEDIVED